MIAKISGAILTQWQVHKLTLAYFYPLPLEATKKNIIFIYDKILFYTF
ncbi:MULTISPECIES: hypothetical protein [Helicobacter]|uniref:Uncharacterized protein n=1 Tax=Helicobacter typhlonius TaxID=76936 RepID=A0A0S4PUF7_9HELI|nr:MULTISPECIES: hypothetical protein [Helicobacter]CUU39660.1 Hypothetical protein BN2458_PEG0774 [Helicobacter typhlonius]